jgi:hypothetical protein
MFFCHFNGLPSCLNSYLFPLVKHKRIVFAANNSRGCEFLVAPTILLCAPTRTIKNARKFTFVNIGST